MKRKGLSWVLAVGLLFTNTSSLYAATTPTPITIIIDGVTQNYAIPPQTINNSTYLPFRAVCESLGATVEFDQPTATATITYHSTIITHKIGTNFLFINGTPKSYTTQSLPNDGNTLAPIRMIAEALNATVLHDPTTNTATITTQQGLTPPAPADPQTTPSPIRTNPNKTAIFLDDTTVVYLEDVTARIRDQEVMAMGESADMIPISLANELYEPSSEPVTADKLVANAKGYIEARYNVDYTTVNADEWWTKIQPYFDPTYRSGNGSAPQQMMSISTASVIDQQLTMTSIFVTDESCVYTVNDSLAWLSNDGIETKGIYPWAVRGTLFYKLDSITAGTVGNRFWILTDGEEVGKWYQTDIEIRLGMSSRENQKAQTAPAYTFWLDEQIIPVQN